MNQRRVGIVDEQGRGRLVHEPTPPVGDGQVLVRVRATMLSPGTQLNGVREVRAGSAAALPQPRRLGYQAAGEVLKVGGAVRDLRPGQRICCFGGGALHADLAVVPQNLCAVLPDAVSDEDASGMNLVLTAMQAFRRADASLGEFMLVVGLGLVGQLTGQFARAAGLYVMGWDTLAGRRSVALGCSADAVLDPRQEDCARQCAGFTEGLGFDAAVMAIGGNGTPALEQVKNVMKLSPDGHAMGAVVMVGGLEITTRWGAVMGNLDLRSSARTGPGYHDEDWEHGRTPYPPVFVRWSTRTNMQLALRMIGDGRIHPRRLITHRLPLSQIDQAVDLLVNQPDAAAAVVLLPEDRS